MSESIDFSLLKGSPEESQAVSAALLNTLKTRGVAKLKNHGLPAELIAEMFDYVSDKYLKQVAQFNWPLSDPQILCSSVRGQDDRQAPSWVDPEPRV